MRRWGWGVEGWGEASSIERTTAHFLHCPSGWPDGTPSCSEAGKSNTTMGAVVVMGQIFGKAVGLQKNGLVGPQSGPGTEAWQRGLDGHTNPQGMTADRWGGVARWL